MKHGMLYDKSELEVMARAEASKHHSLLIGWGVWIASDEATLHIVAKNLDDKEISLTVRLPAPKTEGKR